MENVKDYMKNSTPQTKVQEEPIDQDRLHPCPACKHCTREKLPDYCGCFRTCPQYLRWLKKTWEMVTAPLRHIEAMARRKIKMPQKVGEGV